MFGAVIVSFIPLASAIRYDSEGSKFLDFHPYTGNRNFVFNDTSVDFCVVDNLQNPAFNDIAIKAVKMWHDRLVQVTNNSDVWDMKMHIFPKDTTICDGYVNYYGTPNSTSLQIIGAAGFSDPDTPVANVKVYSNNYEKTLLDLKKGNPNVSDEMILSQFQDMTKNKTNVQLDNTIIERITLHEIGHALGLNHPSYDNLGTAKGIMGYDMSYNRIDDDEVANIVKVYPNGFTSAEKPASINLDQPEGTGVVSLGEIVDLTIEIPIKENELPSENFELYIFPDGNITQKENAPIKIIKRNGQDQIANINDYIKDIHSTSVNFGGNAIILSLQFKAVKEFTNASMIVVSQDRAGFEKQWTLSSVLSVKKALFSDMLLDFNDSSYTIFTRGDNPNIELERNWHHDKLNQE